MLGRHPADPLLLHDAARRVGELVGDGALPFEEGEACVVQWARDAGGSVDRRGLRMRLMHRMRDAAVARRRARENALMAIRWAVRPLLQGGAPAAAIEEAAGAANGEVLAWEEVAAVLGEELAAMRGRRRA